MTENGFQDDDGVVHEHADPQDQATQGHDVELDVEQEHEHEGGNDGDGDNGGHVEWVTVVLQEEQ